MGIDTIAFSPQVLTYLDHVEGETADGKLLTLLTTYLQSQIRACDQEIETYELKYRMTFAEFVEAWEQGAIADRWSHAVERDYMEWEGLEEERRGWLARLRALPRSEGESQSP
jgi:hypothetical protein